ncbi:MAG: N-acetylmannosamine kinase [Clostridiales bacterium GWF2_38_85]|nr:MAG: N-acetylmannosamine kinase [Clostridiales bacterium GWF2_38_85]
MVITMNTVDYTNSSSILQIIGDNMESYSKGQRRIAAYILVNYDRAAYMTATRLGKVVGVSESTVVRFALELGFEGYPELQEAIRSFAKRKLTSLQRITIGDERISDNDILTSVMESDIANLKSTMQNLNNAAFKKTVESLLTAKNIYIIGVRSSSSLASFLAFYFSLIFPNVKLINTNTGEVIEQLLWIGSEDVIIGISFPRYSKRTVDAMRFASLRKATCVAITDSDESPIAMFGDHVLVAKNDITSFVDSLVAPMSIINALIVSVGRAKDKEIAKTFEELEGIWDQYDVFEKHS